MAVAVASIATVPLVERPLGRVEENLPAPDQRQRGGAAQGNRANQAGRLGIDHLHSVRQIVGDIHRPAVGGEGQLRGTAAQRYAAESAITGQQLRRHQVARAVGTPGRAVEVGAEDHDIMSPPRLTARYCYRG